MPRLGHDEYCRPGPVRVTKRTGERTTINPITRVEKDERGRVVRIVPRDVDWARPVGEQVWLQTKAKRIARGEESANWK